MKNLLAKCGADILDHSHITRPTLNGTIFTLPNGTPFSNILFVDLMSYFVLDIEISDENLCRPINSIENLNIFDPASTL